VLMSLCFNFRMHDNSRGRPHLFSLDEWIALFALMHHSSTNSQFRPNRDPFEMADRLTSKSLHPRRLWDMHVHGVSDNRAPWSHLLFVANGVVGVRDMSGPPAAHAWRATQVSNADPSPAIYLDSPIVDGPNPVWPDSLVAGDEARGREIVDQQQQSGADIIKIYSRLQRKVYFVSGQSEKFVNGQSRKSS
jgi:hypothetical protein